MSTCISSREQYVWVSNKRFNTLILFAIEVGQKMASTELEQSFVQSLQETYKNFIGGFDFEMENEFTSLDEKKFWARIFSDVASSIFRREIGNQSVFDWQPSAIGDAYILSRLLLAAIREEELGWHWSIPSLEDGNDKDNMNLRV